MEHKLESYRLRKRRKERFDQIKSAVLSMIPLYNNNNTTEPNETCNQIKENKSDNFSEEKNQSPVCSELGSDYVSEEEDVIFKKNEDDKIVNPIVPTNKYLRYLYWIIMFLFWATCYAIAIELKFGIVYLMLSALLGIYFNTRTGPKVKGEISAYSVFNEDFQSIDGTLKAEQFEREIRYGPATVR